MKLIDADALAAEVASWKRQQHSMNIDYSTGYRCALSAVEGMIASAPTIVAIPVEWMKTKRGNHGSLMDICIGLLLTEWQGTKSIEEQQAESERLDWEKEREENNEHV